MYIEILQPFLIFTCLFLFAIFLPYLLVVGQVVVGVVVVVGGQVVGRGHHAGRLGEHEAGGGVVLSRVNHVQGSQDP